MLRALTITLCLALLVPGVASAKGTKYTIDSVKASFAGVASQSECSAPITFIEYQADLSERIDEPAGKLDLKGHKHPRGGTLRASGYSAPFAQKGAWRLLDCQTDTIFGTGDCTTTNNLPLSLEIDFIQKSNQALRTKFRPFDGSPALGPPLTCGPATYDSGLRGDRPCFGRVKADVLKKKQFSLKPVVCQAQLESPDGATLSQAVKLRVDLTRKG